MEQNGGSLENLINTTLPNNITCTSTNYSVECSSAEEILTLALSPCNRSLIVIVMDIHRTVLLNETLYSAPQPQLLIYSVPQLKNERQFNISVQVVSINGMDYFYILSLEEISHVIGLQLPMTSVPVVCLNTTGTMELFNC